MKQSHGDAKTEKKEGSSQRSIGLGLSAKQLVVICIVAVIYSNGSVPRYPGKTIFPTIVFWAKVLPSMMGFYTLYSYPKDSALMDPEPAFETLSPLPNEIDSANVTEADMFGLVEQHFDDQPMVLRKLVQSRPDVFGKMLDYNHEKLAELYGDDDVYVFTDFSHYKSAVSMPFSEYIKHFTNHTRALYARALPDVHGIVKKNINYDWLAKLMRLPNYLVKFSKALGKKDGNGLFFVGSSHVWTAAHCDIGTSVFIQMQGRKRWVFYGPDQTALLYPYSQHRNVAYNLGVDVHRPNLETHPLFKQARGYEVILEPGDVLIFPSLWWHAIQNLDEVTVGIDIATFDAVNSFKRNAPLTLTTVLNPMLWYTSLSSYLFGRNMRDVYFKGYMKPDEPKDEK